MIKAVVTGAKGRMGAMISNLISHESGMVITAKIDKEGGLENHLNECDVIIDFTTPEAASQNVKIAAAHKIPMIIGTTGLNEEQESSISEAAKSIPIVYAPNMSIGVNTMLRLIDITSKILGDAYDIDIEETHHLEKRDRPSGTAKKMAEVASINMNSTSNYDEEIPPRKSGDTSIRICSFRKKNVVGEHEIIFSGNDEILRISHSAKKRDIFARGAIKAAKWITGKPSGLYDMQDVLSDAVNDKLK